MEAILIYILKTTICLTLLYVTYKSLLAKETFFGFNRSILLLGIVVSLCLPFITISIDNVPSIVSQIENISFANETPTMENVTESIEMQETEEDAFSPNLASIPHSNKDNTIAQKNTTTIPWFKLITIFYLLGVVINIVVLIISYFRMMRLINSGEERKHNNLIYCVVNKNIAPFSWGKYIVLSKNEKKEIEAIITHEEAHIKHLHFLDILFSELVLSFHWFNPFAWKLKQELKDIHEFQADSDVINSGINASKYQLLILEKAVGTSSYALANSFNHSKIKKRITMMLKQKSKSWNRAKLLFLIPVALSAVYIFSCTEVNLKGKSNENLGAEKSIKVFYPPVSSKYSTRVIPFGTSKDTTNNHVTQHTGWDFLAPKGTPVYAFMDGIVTAATKDPIYGNLIKIKHSPELETWYGQNEENLVKEGDWVRLGQKIALVGNSGRIATETKTNERKGTRLHFELKIYGVTISPMTIVNWKEEELNDKMLKMISKREIVVQPLPNYISRDIKHEELYSYDYIKSDFRGNAGDTVYAVKNGIVNFIHDRPSIYGKGISILHENNMQTHYFQCDTILIPYSNKLVEAGEPIAIIGGDSANQSSLLFEITIDDISQNPFEVMKEIFEKEEPIETNNLKPSIKFTPPTKPYDK